MDNEVIEKICRIMCTETNVDPDGTGYAMTDETQKRLGKTYKLWEYRIPVARALAEEFDLG